MVLFLLMLFLLLMIYSTRTQVEDFTTYEDDIVDLSMTYPAEWGLYYVSGYPQDIIVATNADMPRQPKSAQFYAQREGEFIFTLTWWMSRTLDQYLPERLRGNIAVLEDLTRDELLVSTAEYPDGWRNTENVRLLPIEENANGDILVLWQADFANDNTRVFGFLANERTFVSVEFLAVKNTPQPVIDQQLEQLLDGIQVRARDIVQIERRRDLRAGVPLVTPLDDTAVQRFRQYETESESETERFVLPEPAPNTTMIVNFDNGFAFNAPDSEDTQYLYKWRAPIGRTIVISNQRIPPLGDVRTLEELPLADDEVRIRIVKPNRRVERQLNIRPDEAPSGARILMQNTYYLTWAFPHLLLPDQESSSSSLEADPNGTIVMYIYRNAERIRMMAYYETQTDFIMALLDAPPNVASEDELKARLITVLTSFRYTRDRFDALEMTKELEALD